MVESAEITSFYLRPTDGGSIADFLPGQFISVRLFLPELDLLQPRQYSLSSAPNGQYYRISVKRESAPIPDLNGMISNRLHDHVGAGEIIDLSAPSGKFVLQSNNRPIVFISVGVGQTPLMAMMEHLMGNGDQRKITWIHGCRGFEVHAFHSIHEQWAIEHSRVTRHIFYNELDQRSNNNGYHKGWVDLKHVSDGLTNEADYYICGPKPFIEKHYNDLRNLGIEREVIFYEEFGPNTLQLN